MTEAETRAGLPRFRPRQQVSGMRQRLLGRWVVGLGFPGRRSRSRGSHDLALGYGIERLGVQCLELPELIGRLLFYVFGCGAAALGSLWHIDYLLRVDYFLRGTCRS